MKNVTPLKAPKASAKFNDLPQADQIAKLREYFKPGHVNTFQVGDIIGFRPEVKPHRAKEQRDQLFLVLGVRDSLRDWVGFKGVGLDDDLLIGGIQFVKEYQHDVGGIALEMSAQFELVDRAPDPRSEARRPGSQGTEG